MIKDIIKKLIIRGDLAFFMCVTVVFLLPVYAFLLPPFMTLWLIAWFFERRSQNEKIIINDEVLILFILFIGLYLWQIGGLLKAESTASGLQRIVKRISFLVFPLALFIPGGKIMEKINFILRVFAYGTFLFVIFCFIKALSNSLSIQDGKWIFNMHPSDFSYENYFISTRFTSPMHPSYISGYIILSVLISLENLFESGSGKMKRIFWSLITIIFLISIYLASSRAGVLAAIIVLPLYLFYKLWNKFNKWILCITVPALLILLLFIAKTNERVNTDLSYITSDTVQKFIQQDVRYTIWISAINVIKENPFTGVGTGDASSELKKKFLSLGYKNGYYEDMNAHNQFIEIMLENGAIGLTIFIILLGYMTFLAIKDQNILLGLFVLMMIIFFMFETVLNRVAGVTFFPLFAFLLYYYKSSKLTR